MTRPHPVNTKQAINPTNHESTVELAGSRFASNRPHFGSRALWRGNMGTSGGQTGAGATRWENKCLKASLCPSCWACCCPQQKQPWQDDVPGKYTADYFKQDFFWGGGCFKGKREQELLVIILCCFLVRWPVCMKGLSFEGNNINM